MKDPFSLAQVKKIDPKGAYKAYRDWPSLAKRGFEVEFNLPQNGFDRASVLGMGGSASGGDIIAGWLNQKQGKQLSVFKGHIPLWEMSGTLGIACSASGQTEETISMMKTAAGRGATVICISSGGKLMDESKSLGVEHIMMPEIVAPRFMLPFIIFSCLSVLNRAMGLECDGEAREAISALGREAEELDVETSTAANTAKQLATKLMHRTPAIYGSELTRGVGMRFKNTLNENAKKHAYFDVMPDLFHNEVQAWEDPTKEFLPVFLRHSGEDEQTKRKEEKLASILKKRGNQPLEVRGDGEGSLSQLVTMAYRLDMASYYTALGLGRNPFPTRMIDRLKNGS